MPRPSDLSPEIAELICQRIVCGESLRTICENDDFPDKSTVFRWLARDEKFRDQYARAKDIQAEVMAEDLLEIADDGTNDWMDRQYGETTVRVVDNEAIQRSKLRVDTRKWLMGKLQPKKYGEKLDLNHAGKDGGPLVFTLKRVDQE